MTNTSHNNSVLLKASIVVIVKNEEATIAKCLESLLAQTVSTEIVVVDGNSTDKTREIVRQYPVKLLLAAKRDSYGASRNLGVKNSSGKIIFFMDADDYAEPTYCRNLSKHFNDDSIGIVTVRRVAEEERGWFLKMLKVQWKKDMEEKSSVQNVDWKSVTTKGTAFLKKAIVDAGWFDEDMFFGTEDKDIAYRIQNRGYKVIYDISETIHVKPVAGAWDFLKDKFSRAGMGHGYFRRKHGYYKPPLSGITSFILLLTAVYAFVSIPILTFPIIAGAILSLRSIWAEGVVLYQSSKHLKLTIGFIIIKWLSRIVEFFGFLITFIFPVSIIRSLKE